MELIASLHPLRGLIKLGERVKTGNLQVRHLDVGRSGKCFVLCDTSFQAA